MQGKQKKDYGSALSAAVWMFAVCSLFLTSHRFPLICLILLLCFISLLLMRERSSAQMRRIPLLLIILFSAGYLFTRNEYVWYAVCVLSCLNGIAEGILKLKETLHVWKRPFLDDQAGWVFCLLRTVILAGMFIYLSVLSFSPDGMIRRMNPDTLNQREWTSSAVPFGTDFVRTCDLVYDTEFPNGSFDLITKEGEVRPVFVWFHGGGYVSGDKASQDLSERLFKNMLAEGYAVISVNYALSPDYRYPVPLLQADRLFQYLVLHGQELGIDPERILIAGTGSGAEIAAQYLTAAYSETYASLTGINAIPKEYLKAAYLMSACIEPVRADQTDFVLTDFIVYQQYRSYYDCFSLHESKNAQKACFSSYITEDFPPLYIGDGNTGSFAVQAHRLDTLLTEKKIPHEARIFDSAQDNRDLVGLSFDTEQNAYSNAVHGGWISFLREYVPLP